MIPDLNIGKVNQQIAMREAAITQIELTTAIHIFSSLVSNHLLKNNQINSDQLRSCAKIAKECAPFMSEVFGLKKVETNEISDSSVEQ